MGMRIVEIVVTIKQGLPNFSSRGVEIRGVVVDEQDSLMIQESIRKITLEVQEAWQRKILEVKQDLPEPVKEVKAPEPEPVKEVKAPKAAKKAAKEVKEAAPAASATPAASSVIGERPSSESMAGSKAGAFDWDAVENS